MIVQLTEKSFLGMQYGVVRGMRDTAQLLLAKSDGQLFERYAELMDQLSDVMSTIYDEMEIAGIDY